MVIEKLLKLELGAGNIPLSADQLNETITVADVEYHGSRLDGRFDSWIVTLKGKVSDQQFYYPFTMVLMVLTFYDEVLLNQQTQVKLLVEQVFPSFTSIKNILKDTITAIKKAGLSNEH